MKSKGNHQIFLKFMLSYILILITPLLMGIVAYYNTFNMVETDAREDNLAVLEQCRDVLDSRLSENENIVSRLTFNNKIRNLLSVDSPFVEKANVYKILDMQQDISTYKVTNNFIDELYIFFSNSNTMISQNESYIRMSSYYGDLFSYSDMTYVEWYENILNSNHQKHILPAAPVTINRVRKPMLTYIQSLPVTGSCTDKGTIIVFIAESKIQNLLKRITSDSGGWAYIEDDKGQVLTSISYGNSKAEQIKMDFGKNRGFTEKDISGDKMLISYTVSSYNKWKYVAVLPKHFVMQKVAYIKRIIIIIMIVAFLIGLLGACYFAFHNSKPIRKIFESLKGIIDSNIDKPKNEMDLLQDSILKLINSNKTIQEEMEKQIPVLKAAFIERLFTGGFGSICEIENYLKQFDISGISESGVVIIIKINKYYGNANNICINEANAIKVILKEAINSVFNESVFWYDMEFDKIALLMSYDFCNISSYKKYIDSICKKIFDEFYMKSNMKLAFAAGNPVNSLMEIWRSFVEAREALDYKVTKSNAVVRWHNDIPKKGSNYYYPPEFEVQFINCAKSGNYSSIEKLINDLLLENFQSRQLSSAMIRQLVYNMTGTILKILDQANINDIEFSDILWESVNQINNCITCDEMKELLLSSYKMICVKMNDSKRSHNTELMMKIEEYIRSGFTEQNMCLLSVAEAFSMTKTYLSQFFKEQTGENFSDYLEKIRIEHACELLDATEITVAEISEKVGYNSPHVFRSAFKRIKGITPTAFQSSLPKNMEQ